MSVRSAAAQGWPGVLVPTVGGCEEIRSLCGSPSLSHGDLGGTTQHVLGAHKFQGPTGTGVCPSGAGGGDGGDWGDGGGGGWQTDKATLPLEGGGGAPALELPLSLGSSFLPLSHSLCLSACLLRDQHLFSSVPPTGCSPL